MWWSKEVHGNEQGGHVVERLTRWTVRVPLKREAAPNASNTWPDPAC
jgi:hypothetical protein